MTNVMKLSDGVLVEVAEVYSTSQDRTYEHAAGHNTTTTAASLSSIEEYIPLICEPLARGMTKVRESLDVTQMEVRFNIGIEGGGNFFVVKSSSSANFEIKLVIDTRD